MLFPRPRAGTTSRHDHFATKFHACHTCTSMPLRPRPMRLLRHHRPDRLPTPLAAMPMSSAQAAHNINFNAAALIFAAPARAARQLLNFLIPSISVPNAQFIKGFLCGGFLFSAILCLVGFYSILGAENFRRVLDLRRLVFERVWNIFLRGLGAASITLRKDDGWNFREAWSVLREQWRETRQAAAEAIEALRVEAGLNAVAVGKPGLVALQYSVDHFTPKLLARMLERSLAEALSTVSDEYVRAVELADFDIGKTPPELLDARAYELGDDAMAFDIDVAWQSEIRASMLVDTGLLGVNVPISVRNFRFVGVVRVVLSPLLDEPPGFGAALISLPSNPKVGLDVRMAGGEVTKMPWLRTEIMSTIQSGIEDQYLWPRRVVIPSMSAPSLEQAMEPMLSPDELEELSTSDPLLRAERSLAERPAFERQRRKEVNTLEKEKDKEDLNVDVDVLLSKEECDVDNDDGCVVYDWRFDDKEVETKPDTEKKNPLQRVWGGAAYFVHGLTGKEHRSQENENASNDNEVEEGNRDGARKKRDLLLERVGFYFVSDRVRPGFEFVHGVYKDNAERIFGIPENDSLLLEIKVKEENCEADDDEECLIEAWISNDDGGQQSHIIDTRQETKPSHTELELPPENAWWQSYELLLGSR